MSEQSLSQLLEHAQDRVQDVLNILLESPYFYRDDHEEAFFFLRRHRAQFADFFEAHFGWTLYVDAKCARVYKPRWVNPAITEANRDIFDFRRRDDCLAFLILLEFFEHQLEENAMTVEDPENLRFRLGDLLGFARQRFLELYPELGAERYSEDAVRQVYRQVMPVLERYRFLRRLPPPADLDVADAEVIYEALPALYHYNAERLSQGLGDAGEAPDGRDPELDEADAGAEAPGLGTDTEGARESVGEPEE
jgi:hypothetical protein